MTAAGNVRGEWSTQKGEGRGIRFLKALIGHRGDDCVTWPLWRDPVNGYGRCGYNGKVAWAHRLMCALAHGDAPSAKHEAAHTCGKGHEGCINPKHLEWKTRVQNQADRYLHRRKPHRTVRFKLTEADVAEIRALGPTTKTKDLAARFKVSQGNIRQILIGQTWVDGKRAKCGFAVKPYRGGSKPRSLESA